MPPEIDRKNIGVRVRRDLLGHGRGAMQLKSTRRAEQGEDGMNADSGDQLRELLNMARALLRSMDGVVSSSATRDGDVWHFSSYRAYAEQYNRLVKAVLHLGVVDQGILGTYDMKNMPGIADTIPIQQTSYFQSIHGSLSMLCAFLESKTGVGEASHELRELHEFLTERLRPAMIEGKPENEKAVQNTVEQILIGRGMRKGIDYDRETGRVKHSGKESVPDFLFSSLSAVLEIKLVKDRASVSRIVDEMNADVLAYGKKYPYVLFLVYDVGGISDVGEFKRDFESNGKATVIVVKH